MGITKSTRYDYYYVQNVTPINNGWLPDPVTTYASSANALGSEISSFVISKLQNGMGIGLRQYYQYATHRFANRNWNTEWFHSGSIGQIDITDRLLKSLFKSELPTHVRIQSYTDSPEIGGELLSQYLKDKYNIDYFNRVIAGREFNFAQPTITQFGLLIGYYDTEKTEPVIIDYIPEPSIGLTYHYADKPEIKITNEKHQIVWGVSGKSKKRLKTYTKTGSKETEVLDSYSVVTEDSKVTIYEDWQEINGSDVYTYTKVITLDYNKEGYIYSSSSHPNFKVEKLFRELHNINRPKSEPRYNKVLKLYPYIPLKEFDGTKDDLGTDVIDYGQSKLVPLLREMNEEDKKNQEDELLAEATDRKEFQRQRKNSHSDTRKISRELSRSRRLNVIGLRNQVKPMSNQAVKRHLDHMAKLLSLDYVNAGANILASDNANDYRDILLMPSVSLATNENDIMCYWFNFIGELYNQLGKEQNYHEYLGSLQTAKTLKDVRYNKVIWNNEGQMFHGGMGFNFIRELTIEGTTRNIKRIRRVYEIKRGIPTEVTLETLRELLEPSSEMAIDEYYTTNKGTDFCIGGQEYKSNGRGDESDLLDLVYKDFDYTFFCKLVGHNKLRVYAVAGLSFTTKQAKGSNVWGRGWLDLSTWYKTNYNRYVKHKPEAEIIDFDQRRGKRYKHINQLHAFSVVPLDYNTVRKMSIVDLERFSQRAVQQYIMLFKENKHKAKWVKPFIEVIGYVLAVVSAIYDRTGTTTQMIMATVRAMVVAIVTKLAVKFFIAPLLRLLGIKGLVATIIMMIATVLASYGISSGLDMASMPYASQTAPAQIASKFTMENVKTMATEAIKNVTALDIAQVGMKGLQMYNERQSTKLSQIQNQMVEEQNAFNEATMNLADKQEDFNYHQHQGDVKEIMENLRVRFNLKDPTVTLTYLTDSTDFLASYDYLVSFLDQRISLELEGFDPVESLDFSTKLK